MPVNIGQRAESFDNPLGLLTDCHRRIEMFLRVLVSIAAQADGSLSDEQRQAMETALRYFREAAPKHTADEEESLFPRMRNVDSGEVRSAMQQLNALEHDHRTAERLHATVDQLGLKWMETNQLDAKELQSLRSALTELKTIYDRHIAVEDEQVFPLARLVLAIDEQKAVGEEMASRRGAKNCQP